MFAHAQDQWVLQTRVRPLHKNPKTTEMESKEVETSRSSRTVFPGKVIKIIKKLKQPLDGKSSCVIVDANGKALFWYMANAIPNHKQVEADLDRLTFVDEKSFYDNPPTHQKLWMAPFDFVYRCHVGPLAHCVGQLLFCIVIRDSAIDQSTCPSR